MESLVLAGVGLGDKSTLYSIGSTLPLLYSVSDIDKVESLMMLWEKRETIHDSYKHVKYLNKTKKSHAGDTESLNG